VKKYRVEVSKTAEKQLHSLGRQDQVRVVRAIQDLAEDLRPAGARKLTGYDAVYRIRVGVYRILYEIEDRLVTVIILKIGHRRDVYR